MLPSHKMGVKLRLSQDRFPMLFFRRFTLSQLHPFIALSIPKACSTTTNQLIESANWYERLDIGRRSPTRGIELCAPNLLIKCQSPTGIMTPFSTFFRLLALSTSSRHQSSTNQCINKTLICHQPCQDESGVGSLVSPLTPILIEKQALQS